MTPITVWRCWHTVLYSMSTREVEVSFIVPSRLHQMCLPQDNRRACRSSHLPRHLSGQLFSVNNSNHKHRTQTQPSLCIPRASSTVSRASILHLHPETPQYHHQQQVIHHALSGLGRHPLPQGLPGAVQGVQDHVLRRAGWQWRRVRRLQWYVHAF
jgi:hypothetical protein